MAKKEAKKEIKVVNIVVSTALEKDIPLEKMAATLPNTEYNPEQFPGLVLRIKDPKTSALIFSSGKVVCTGARSMEKVDESIIGNSSFCSFCMDVSTAIWFRRYRHEQACVLGYLHRYFCIFYRNQRWRDCRSCTFAFGRDRKI